MKQLPDILSEGLLTSGDASIPTVKYQVSADLIKLSMVSNTSEYGRIANKVVKDVLGMHPKKYRNIRIPADGIVYISWVEGIEEYPIISVYFNKSMYAFYKWKGVFQVRK